jgi:hypothetical protein
VLAPLPPERYTVSSNCACFISNTMNTCVAALRALNNYPLPPDAEYAGGCAKIQLYASVKEK